jgi:hypothetical protein
MLPKIGIDPAEFGVQTDGFKKAVNVYTDGADMLPGATPEYNLWSSLPLLSTYDMGIFSCNCTESLSYGDPAFKAVTDYLDQGGRIFTTDYQYTWYRYSPDPQLGAASATNLTTTGIGTVQGGAPIGNDPLNLNTTFPKGLALAQWLAKVFPASPYGQVNCDVVFDNVTSLNTKAQTFASSTPGPDPRVFTVNTPVGVPEAQQCGKGVHIDAHVDTNGADSVACNGTTCYPNTCTDPLTQGEAMFAFFFFDLASCVQTEPPPPPPPPPQ